MTKQEELRLVNGQIRQVDERWRVLHAEELACGNALSRLTKKRIKILAQDD